MMAIGIGTAVIIFTALMVVFLVAPGRLSEEAKKTARLLAGRSFAHRGLYKKDQSIAENSLEAFAAARKAGYGVELDVQLTRDGQVVVFHDGNLRRACGVDVRVDALDLQELGKYRLFGGEAGIPLLTEALETLGDVPVIVELKSMGKRNAEICRKTLDLLREKGKNWCVESFDPRIVFWFRKNAPEVLRGQLSDHPKRFDSLPGIQRFALGHLLSNGFTRPHFIAYGAGNKPLSVRLCHKMKPMKVVWTVREEKEHSRNAQENDAVIFEHYTPPVYVEKKE